MAGAKGLKILETLGLYLRENVSTGPLVRVDDRRFDRMWESAGACKMPVAIHTSDMEAFFLPVDRLNERYEQLTKHPDWSFYGWDFPSNMELQEGSPAGYAASSEDSVRLSACGRFGKSRLCVRVSGCASEYARRHRGKAF